MTRNYKTRNPYRIDEYIHQEIHTGTELQLDYSHCNWIALDTEFLSVNPLLDQLCVIQIASQDQNDPEKIRVEIIHVFGIEADPKLRELLVNENIEKIFHNFQTDMSKLELFIGKRLKGAIFDTFLASKLLLTNVRSDSLETLIQYLIDPSFNKDKGITVAEWDLEMDMWEDRQFEYAANDVLYLKRMKDRFEEIAKRRGKEELLKETMNIIPTLSELIKAGYKSDIFIW